ncbi:MAG: hypothetical protein CBC65_001670 [Rhodothermaceae bacterium TMED105]|nr:MAG: hypothetical protein CBC65_001670 [Rhodothermaceae bacterium TMED105]
MPRRWSNKYKRSIDCKRPKGFSQKAHCRSRLKSKSRRRRRFRSSDRSEDDFMKKRDSQITELWSHFTP